MGMFKKAERTQAKARIALVGPSGSGKTYTALRIAAGLGERIAVIDTEHGSASKYAGLPGLPAFDVLELTRHHPDEYISAIRAAEAEGYDVLIIDSLSHAWNGRDGALELVDRASAAGGRDNNFAAWAKVTPLQSRLIDALTGARVHLLATMRAKTVYSVVPDPAKPGKTKPVKLGIGPVQREGVEYEFDVVVELDVEEHTARITKSRCADLDGYEQSCAGEDLGRAIGAWLSDGAAPVATSGKWSPIIAKVVAPRAALQTLLAIWRGEPNALVRDAALEECAERFLAVSTTASEVASAIDWADQAEDLRMPEGALTTWRSVLDERISAEQAAAAAEPDFAHEEDAPVFPWDEANDQPEFDDAAIEAEQMEMIETE